MPNSPYTYGGASYYPLTDNSVQETPIPVPQPVGEWVHVPYSSVNKWEGDGGNLHTVWQVPVLLPSTADYTVFRGLLGRFASLSSPFGTFSAKLQSLNVRRDRFKGDYVGDVVWEWA